MAAPGEARAGGPADVADLPFLTVCRYINTMHDLKRRTSKKREVKGQVARFLLDQIRRPANLYPLVRLLFPEYDTRVYNMKEDRLEQELSKVFPRARDMLRSYKEGGSLAATAREALAPYVKQGHNSGSLTVGKLNQLLDNLSRACRSSGAAPPGTPATQRSDARRNQGRRDERGAALQGLVSRLHKGEVQHVVTMMLKQGHKMDMRWEAFALVLHQDAADVMASVTSVEEVCKRCADPERRIVPEITLGQKFALQRCGRDSGRGGRAGQRTTAAMAKAIHGKLAPRSPEFLVETKFDGWRMCVHVGDVHDKSQYWFFSRSLTQSESMGEGRYNFNVMQPAFLQQAAFRNAIFDGEVVVWNRRANCFMPFPTVLPVLNAARDHVPPGELIREARGPWPDGAAGEGPPAEAARELEQKMLADDMELLYCVFDVLWLDDANLSALPLRVRLQYLDTALRPGPAGGVQLEGGHTCITARIVKVLPDSQPLVDWPGSASWSIRGSTVADITEGFERTEVEDSEGVVVKALDAPYKLSLSYPSVDTAGWVKWKRDYGQSWEVDVLIVGGMFKSAGAAAGIVTYVCALSDPRGRHAGPAFLTFTRVYTGLTEQQRLEVNHRLQPHLRSARLPNKAKDVESVPEWLSVAQDQEWPDMWVSDYQQSLVLEIKGDVRLSQSNTYATGCTLRFPRIVRLREPADKDWTGVATLAELRELQAAGAKAGAKSPGKAKERVVKTAQVASAFAQLSSDAVVEADVLAGAHVQVPPRTCLAGEQKYITDLVTRLGGRTTFTVKKSRGTDRVVFGSASERATRAIREAHKSSFGTETDILRMRWLEVCLDRRELVPPCPADFIHLSDRTFERLTKMEGFDRFGSDMYAYPDEEDAQALLCYQVPRAKDIYRKALQVAGSVRSKEQREEQVAAVGAPAEATPGELRDTVQRVACADGGGAAARHGCSLGGASCLLLFLPAELDQPPAGESTADEAMPATSQEVLACLWAARAYAEGARVVGTNVRLSEAAAASALLTPAQTARLGFGEGDGEATHVVLLPLRAARLLEVSLHEESSSNDAGLSALLAQGFFSWTQSFLAAALADAVPSARQLTGLCERLADGRATLVSAQWLLGLGDGAGTLEASCLDLPTASGPASRAQLQSWLLGLPWPDACTREAAKQAAAAGKPRAGGASKTGKKRGAPRKRSAAGAHDGSGDDAAQAQAGAHTPGPRGTAAAAGNAESAVRERFKKRARAASAGVPDGATPASAAVGDGGTVERDGTAAGAPLSADSLVSRQAEAGGVQRARAGQADFSPVGSVVNSPAVLRGDGDAACLPTASGLTRATGVVTGMGRSGAGRGLSEGGGRASDDGHLAAAASRHTGGVLRSVQAKRRLELSSDEDGEGPVAPGGQSGVPGTVVGMDAAGDVGKVPARAALAVDSVGGAWSGRQTHVDASGEGAAGHPGLQGPSRREPNTGAACVLGAAGAPRTPSAACDGGDAKRTEVIDIAMDSDSDERAAASGEGHAGAGGAVPAAAELRAPARGVTEAAAAGHPSGGNPAEADLWLGASGRQGGTAVGRRAQQACDGPKVSRQGAAAGVQRPTAVTPAPGSQGAGLLGRLAAALESSDSE